MQIAACRVTFRLSGNGSLKGKRQVSRSLIARLRQRFNLAVAEVDAQDQLQTLVIGFVALSNHSQHASEMIDAALAFVGAQRIDAEIVEVERDLIGGV